MEDYLARLPPEQRAALERVCEIVARTTPDAEIGRSYGMPAFRHAGRPLLGFRAAKAHLSVFPFSPEAVAAVRDRLPRSDVSKGTVRFTPDRPLPEDVIADLVRLRAREIDA